MPHDRILVLAGTTEARDLATALVEQGRDVVSSFAGVTTSPLLPPGEIQLGGFGGVEGLLAFIKSRNITRIIDATHPFAAQMSEHAFVASQDLHVPLLRLERPAWQPQPGDNWITARSMVESAQSVPPLARVFITTGRKSLQQFFARADLTGMIRTIEPPATPLPPHWKLVLDRPPHSLAGEMALMRRESITCLVSKNAGGDATSAKLAAARALDLPVVMVARPGKPICKTVTTVKEAMLGISQRAG